MNVAAIHEAGHAVVARKLGAHDVWATIGPHESGEASFDAFRPAQYGDLEPLRRHLTFLMSGPVAEVVAEGRDPLGPASEEEIANRILFRERAPWTRADGTSYQSAYDWLKEEALDLSLGDPLLAFDAVTAFAVPALRRAARLVRTHWAEIEQTAERLETATAITV